MNIDSALSFVSVIFLSQTPLLYSITAALSLESVDSFQKFLSLALCVVVLLLVISKIVKRKLHVTKAFLLVCCFSLVIIVLYLFTPFFYTSVPQTFYSYFLALCSSGVPAIVLGAILAETNDPLPWFIKGVNIVAGTVSITTLVILLTTDLSVTVNELNKAGLTYQQFSYYAVYAYSLNLFLILSKGAIRQTKIAKILRIVSAVINVICALSGGGRGALILLFVISVYYLLFYLPWGKVNVNKLIKSACAMSFAIFIFYYITTKTTFIRSGVERVVNLFANTLEGQSEERNVSYATALNIFLEKPVFGHGLGSVFPEWGFYLHDIFLDLAVEAGLFGIVVFLVLLLVFIVDFHKLRKQDHRYDLIAVLFLNEFVMFLFSGYYLSGARLWFCISFCIIAATRLDKERKYMKC